MNKKTFLILLFILFFTVGYGANISKIDYQTQDDEERISIETDKAVKYECYPLNDISIIIIKDSILSDEVSLEGEGKLIKTVNAFQFTTDPTNSIAILLQHANPVHYEIDKNGFGIISGSEEYPDQPENIFNIAKERYRNKLFEIAEEMFAVEKYDEATVMYNSIYGDNFYVPLYIINQVRMELKMEPIKVEEVVKAEIPAEEIVEEEPVEEIIEEEEPTEVVVEEEPVEEIIEEEEPTEVVVEEEEPVEEIVKVETPTEEIVEEEIPEEVVEEEPVEEIVEEEPVEEIIEEEEPTEVVVEEEPVKVLNIISEIALLPEKEMTRLQIVADTKLMYEFRKNDKAASIEIKILDAKYEYEAPQKGGYIKAISGNQQNDNYIINIAYVKDADISIFPIDNIIECDILRPIQKVAKEKKKYVQFETPKEKTKT
jgi:hypothetical protein